MRYFPVNLDIRGKDCVVVGGGSVALRKVSSLLKGGARVRVVSPELTDALKEILSTSSIEWTDREYTDGDLSGASLAFVAVNNPNIGKKVAEEAKERNVPVNVADEPSDCTFTLPSYIERGDLMITVSTGGRCPAFSKHLRLELEEMIGPAYGEALNILGDAREKLLTGGIDFDRCKILLNELISSDMIALIKEGRNKDAMALASNSVNELIGSGS